MIKLPESKRTKLLTKALDSVIANYKAPGKLVGAPNDNPKISEADLAEARKKGDVIVAPDVFTYYIENYDQKIVKASAGGLFPRSQLASISGAFHYPEKGFMGWHTNSNFEGWRVYASYVAEGNKSFFRYFKNNKVHTEDEKKGWNFRAFEVKKSNLYWHCVYTDIDRFSFGFRFALEQ